jgi:hypothetical protein
VNDPEIKSKETPANKIIPSANPHNSNGFPLGLYWKILNPHIAKNQRIRISNPVKIVIKLKLNNRKLAMANINTKIITIAKIIGNMYLSSIFLKILYFSPRIIKEYLPFVKVIDFR